MKTGILLILAFYCMIISLSAQNAVVIPDTLSGTTFELTLQNGTFQFYSGQNTTTMGVNGDILGPTLIMQQGDFVDITVNNQLSDTTTVHWHGMHVSASNDGGPHTFILSGDSWNPSFTVMDRAGTYWYHPHLHKKTNKHVSLGIAGFIIVRDNEEGSLNLPRTYGVDDFPLVIQTKDFDADKQIVVPSNSDDVLMVNATIDPYLDVPAQVVRFRLLNGSSQRVFNIGLSDNLTFYQIGSDGGLLSEPVALTRLQIAPGERAEILIDFEGMEEQAVQLMSYAFEFQNGIYGATNPGMMQFMTLNGYNPNALNGTNFDIIEFNVGVPTSDPVYTVPETLVNVTPIPESSADITRNLFFSPAVMGPDQLNHNFLINGTSFNMDLINYTIPLNNIEIWSIFNQSAIAHPFHIHDVQFFVLDRNGVPPSASEQGRKDVILVKPQETVRFITQFTDFANDDVPYMYHCHMLVHEDDGMMGQFSVVDDATGIKDGYEEIRDIKVFPNPITTSTTIEYELKQLQEVTLAIYNYLGEQVEVVQENQPQGKQQLIWNAEGLSDGIYYYSLQAGEQVSNGKIVKVR